MTNWTKLVVTGYRSPSKLFRSTLSVVRCDGSTAFRHLLSNSLILAYIIHAGMICEFVTRLADGTPLTRPSRSISIGKKALLAWG